MAIANIPKIKIGDLEVTLVQGGMGVGVSGHGLSSAVAEEGGAGIIASACLGVHKNYPGDYAKANSDALRDEIRAARKKTNGVIGVNIMHVLSDYSTLVETAVEENVDLIISGAGIPKDLPRYLNGKNIKLVPIVSSARVADIMCKAWSKLGHIPDAIVVEGPKAGGHLGYSIEQLSDSRFVSRGLEEILLPEIITAVKPYENSNKKIPIIAAGGIFYGGDIARVNRLGAAGVQMATRFVTTYECDADIRFKETYLNSKKEDTVIIQSPVGMPGRAIKDPFLEEVKIRRADFGCNYQCLKSCNPSTSPYCIAHALVEAQQGRFGEGFVFCGSNAYLCKEIVSVKELFSMLEDEYAQGKLSD